MSGIERAGTPTVLYYQEEAPARPVLWDWGLRGFAARQPGRAPGAIRAVQCPAAAPFGHPRRARMRRWRSRPAEPLAACPFPAIDRVRICRRPCTVRPENVRYQTRLGRVRNPSGPRPPPKISANSPNLSEGAYSFMVAGRQAATASGPTRRRTPSVILPPWYPHDVGFTPCSRWPPVD